jgi:hypothetical protein
LSVDAADNKGQPVLDEPAGREDDLGTLRRRLTTAPAAYLDGAISNPVAGVSELLLLLQNRVASEAVLRRIDGDREWTRHHRVRRALALHPRTPVSLGRGILRHLYWKELLELSVAPHVNPILRRLADRKLADRLPSLSLGEQVALARRAGRGLIRMLCDSESNPVLEALLGNPRLIEADVARIAAGATAPPESLDRLASHPRWGCRREIRLALVKNERTPGPVALGMLWRTPRHDLQSLLRERGLPPLVRAGAERLLLQGGRLDRVNVAPREVALESTDSPGSQ